ncbi:MAG: hypothetical protein QW057_00655 [Candidatus Bathyarchaeia archaeon]
MVDEKASSARARLAISSSEHMIIINYRENAIELIKRNWVKPFRWLKLIGKTSLVELATFQRSSKAQVFCIASSS